jgi:predicted DNA-binding transcriptional regulator YafY
MFGTIRPGDRIRFPYTNHRGVTEERDVIVQSIQYGSNEHYPEPQWFLGCYDCSRKGYRSFAVNRIDPTKVEKIA